jgi:hypothetical protein
MNTCGSLPQGRRRGGHHMLSGIIPGWHNVGPQFRTAGGSL